jgi:hypothetical protein
MSKHWVCELFLGFTIEQNEVVLQGSSKLKNNESRGEGTLVRFLIACSGSVACNQNYIQFAHIILQGGTLNMWFVLVCRWSTSFSRV